MKLVLLVSVFLLLCGVSFLAFDHVYTAMAGRWALSAMFVFAGVLHLTYREGIYLTYPEFLPQTFRIRLVFAIGDLQFAFAAAFILTELARTISVVVLIYLLTALFTQINACVNKISVKRGNYTGKGLSYLVYKIPEQLFIIAWVYYFGLVA